MNVTLLALGSNKTQFNTSPLSMRGITQQGKRAMNLNLLSWITNAVEQAVLRGVANAVAKLGIEDEADAAEPLAAIRDRMRAALPEASSNGTVEKVRKGK